MAASEKPILPPGVTLKSRPVYVTSDGTEHEEFAAAVKHETLSGVQAELSRFLAASELTGRAASRVRNLVLRWEEWKRQLPLPFEDQPDEPPGN